MSDDDKVLIDSLCPNEKAKFETWFEELNRLNISFDVVWYNGARLENTTGVRYWFDYFTDGLTPSEALEEDDLNR